MDEGPSRDYVIESDTLLWILKSMKWHFMYPYSVTFFLFLDTSYLSGMWFGVAPRTCARNVITILGVLWFIN
jgi:hypothetical protein